METSTRRDATQLHRDAVVVFELLQDLDPDDHATRERLEAARLAIRAEAATLWRLHGWRAITDDR